MIVDMPKKVLVEKSVKEHINGFLSSLNLGKKAAIVCTDNIRTLIIDDVRKAITGTDTTILDVSESEKIKEYDFAIAAGGGKTIDIVKYECHKSGIPWISFPTILSHDGIISSRASVTDKGSRVSVQACEPSAIIADLETISKAPYRLIASGFGDLVSNISAVEDWKIADRAGKEKYSMLIGELSLLSARSVIAHTKEIKKMDYHGLEVQLWSLICSGFAMNLHGSSRPCSGSEHNFAHALDTLGCSVLHGDACGLGTIVSTCLQGGDWQTIKDILQVAGLPVTAKEIEIDKSVLIEALVRARSIRERYTVLDEKKLAKKSAEDVLKKVGII